MVGVRKYHVFKTKPFKADGAPSQLKHYPVSQRGISTLYVRMSFVAWRGHDGIVHEAGVDRP